MNATDAAAAPLRALRLPLWWSVACLAALSCGCLAHHTGPMPGEPAQATYTQLGETRVRYTDTGSGGAPVVLIHGFASSLDTWGLVAPALKANHRVIALDLKGFGWTDRPRGDYSPAAQAKLILALLDELGVEEPVALVAHSWGASVALATAMSAPQRVRRIALYDAWVYAEQLPTFFLWARTASLGELLVGLFYNEQSDLKMASAFYDQRFVTEALVEEVEAALDRPGTRAAALAAIRGQRYELVQDQYATITQPTLLLWGREDAVTPLWVGERLARQLPDARLKIYPRCGHFPMLEAAAASTRELRDFLSADLSTAAVTRDTPAPPKEEPAVIAPPPTLQADDPDAAAEAQDEE